MIGFTDKNNPEFQYQKNNGHSAALAEHKKTKREDWSGFVGLVLTNEVQCVPK